MVNLSSLHSLVWCAFLALFFLAVRETVLWFFADWSAAQWAAIRPEVGRPLPPRCLRYTALCFLGSTAHRVLGAVACVGCVSLVLNILRVLGLLWI